MAKSCASSSLISNGTSLGFVFPDELGRVLPAELLALGRELVALASSSRRAWSRSTGGISSGSRFGLRPLPEPPIGYQRTRKRTPPPAERRARSSSIFFSSEATFSLRF
jgi:hypothetical protein